MPRLDAESIYKSQLRTPRKQLIHKTVKMKSEFEMCKILPGKFETHSQISNEQPIEQSRLQSRFLFDIIRVSIE